MFHQLQAGANPDAQTACHTHLSGLVVKDRAALHFACDEVNLDIVQLLLDHDADVNVEDKQGRYHYVFVQNTEGHYT